MGRAFWAGVMVLASCGGTVSPSPDAGGSDATTADVALDEGSPVACSGPSVCTSGTTSLDASTPSTTHAAGQACNACHVTAAGPVFGAAGTVYPTCHEPDLCSGLSGVTVTIRDDAQNVVLTMLTNSAGNFFTMIAPLPSSFTATLTHGANQTTTTTAHADGDCNKCHTETGGSGAPGRLFVP